MTVITMGKENNSTTLLESPTDIVNSHVSNN
ncbi:uncharacterized protein METZ01_LOCUS331605, partial [marine metagenome]